MNSFLICTEQLKVWYQLRNYDEKSGLPRSEELKRLGLEDIL